MPVDVSALVRVALDGGDSDYSAPYRYKITKSDGTMRPLSLAHPKAQLNAANFLTSYDHLITYYAGRSRFSLRYPARVASTFIYRSPYADMHKYRDANVDAVGEDRIARHPSSYFAYGGHTRYHQFFASDDFYSLEKGFSRLLMLDISKCFSSIYTHTVTWAVKDMPHGKQHTGAVSFGNEFDRVMQRMNYNETNGLAVGSEVSRICAEIVLQAVDDRVETRLQKLRLAHGVDYGVRRYVDDFTVFSNSASTEATVRHVIADELSKFNLHLNDSKSVSLARPFQTGMSAVNDAIARVLDEFWNAHTIRDGDDRRMSFAKMVGGRQSVARRFIRTLKTICYEQDADYGSVASFVIAAIDIRIQWLIDSADRRKKDADLHGRHLDLMLCLLEIAFFLYSVSPSVPASAKLARSIILIHRFTTANLTGRVDQVSEEVLQWALDFFSQPFGHEELDGAHVPIEQLNVLLALGELGSAYRSRLEATLLRLIELAPSDYFTIVTSLYVARGTLELMEVTSAIEAAIRKGLPNLNLSFRSADAHLALDVLGCPYLTEALRHAVLQSLFQANQLGAIGKARRDVVIADFSNNPWFVRWGRIDLLRMLERRELNSVY